MAPKADEKYIKRLKNTLLAECKSFLKIYVQFDEYKRDMLCFRSSSQFSLCLQLLSSTCINENNRETRRGYALLLNVTLMNSCLLWWTSMCSIEGLRGLLPLSLVYLSIHIQFLHLTFLEIVQKS